jgi:spore maturation protein CgeB
VENDRADPFRGLIPYYDFVLTYGGGPAVVEAYHHLGARACIPIYNALDPHTHFPTTQDKRFECDLAFLGNRLPDREARVQEFFLTAAELLPDHSFVLGGSGWGDKLLPPNVRYVGHVFTPDHNAFNCTPKAVLNVNRESMARYGFSPPTRVFEAAGAGACLITDAWKGIDQFFMPGTEVLVASSGEEVARYVSELTRDHARKIGESARRRVLTEHTYQQRVAVLEKVLAEGHRSLAPLEKEAV